MIIYDIDEYVIEVFRVGVVGYLLKEMDVYEFVEVVKIVDNGGVYIYLCVVIKLICEYCYLVSINIF